MNVAGNGSKMEVQSHAVQYRISKSVLCSIESYSVIDYSFVVSRMECFVYLSWQAKAKSEESTQYAELKGLLPGVLMACGYFVQGGGLWS